MDTHITKLLFTFSDFTNAPKNLRKETKEMGSQTGTGQGKVVFVLIPKAYKGPLNEPRQKMEVCSLSCPPAFYPR